MDFLYYKKYKGIFYSCIYLYLSVYVCIPTVGRNLNIFFNQNCIYDLKALFL